MYNWLSCLLNWPIQLWSVHHENRIQDVASAFRFNLLCVLTCTTGGILYTYLGTQLCRWKPLVKWKDWVARHKKISEMRIGGLPLSWNGRIAQNPFWEWTRQLEKKISSQILKSTSPSKCCQPTLLISVQVFIIENLRQSGVLFAVILVAKNWPFVISCQRRDK